MQVVSNGRSFGVLQIMKPLKMKWFNNLDVLGKRYVGLRKKKSSWSHNNLNRCGLVDNMLAYKSPFACKSSSSRLNIFN